MRGDGTTTRQMQAAPQGAYYIWVNNNFSYPKHLAHKLGRDDLKFIGPEDLFRKLIGTERIVVLDHAAHLSRQDSDALFEHHQRLRMRGLI